MEGAFNHIPCHSDIYFIFLPTDMNSAFNVLKKIIEICRGTRRSWFSIKKSKQNNLQIGKAQLQYKWKSTLWWTKVQCGLKKVLVQVLNQVYLCKWKNQTCSVLIGQLILNPDYMVFIPKQEVYVRRFFQMASGLLRRLRSQLILAPTTGTGLIWL